MSEQPFSGFRPEADLSTNNNFLDDARLGQQEAEREQSPHEGITEHYRKFGTERRQNEVIMPAGAVLGHIARPYVLKTQDKAYLGNDIQEGLSAISTDIDIPDESLPRAA